MNNVFINAYKSLSESDDKHLSLTERRRVLLAFGEYNSRAKLIKQSKGKRYRTLLALRCLEKLLSFSTPKEIEKFKFAKQMSDLYAYLDCSASEENLNRSLNQLLCILDDFSAKLDFSMQYLIGHVLSKAMVVALADEEILSAPFMSACDNDLDPFTWDTAFISCKIYEGKYSNFPSYTLLSAKSQENKRYEFWTWYIEEARKLYDEFILTDQTNR